MGYGDGRLAKDTTGQDGEPAPRKPRRKGVTIDLPSEEVGRRSSAEADAGADRGDPSPDSDPAVSDVEMAKESAEEMVAADAEPAVAEAPAEKRAETRASVPPESPPHTEQAAGRDVERPGLLVPLAIASIVGGAVVALVVILLVLAGYLVPVRTGEDFSSEIAALQSDVTKLQDTQDTLAPLRDAVASLKQSVDDIASRPAGADAQALADIEARVVSLEQLSKSSTGLVGSDVDARLSALADDVAALKASGAAPAEAGTALTDIRDQINALSVRLDAMPTADQVAALATRLDALTKDVPSAKLLGRAVAAEALQTALDRGRPFQAELAALGVLGVDQTALDGLKPYAEAGLPTLAALAASFDEVTASIDLAPPVEDNAGTVARLLESARGLVEVRPAHPTAGSDPGAIVARIKGALAAGDLKTALAEWASLPDSVKTPTADWAHSAEARQSADTLVAKLRADALSLLTSAE